MRLGIQVFLWLLIVRVLQKFWNWAVEDPRFQVDHFWPFAGTLTLLFLIVTYFQGE